MAEFDVSQDLIRFVVTWVLTALFIHFAARLVLDRSSLLSALLVALIGSVLAVLVGGLVGGNLGLALAVATWALVCAIFYRTSWIKGAIIGLVAWVLYLGVTLLVRAVVN
jgi:hypothetical protein